MLPEQTHCHPAIRLWSEDQIRSLPSRQSFSGSHCTWQNRKLLPVAFKALQDLSCWPRPSLLPFPPPHQPSTGFPPVPQYVQPSLPTSLWLPAGNGWMLRPTPVNSSCTSHGVWGHPSHPPVTAGGSRPSLQDLLRTTESIHIQGWVHWTTGPFGE